MQHESQGIEHCWLLQKDIVLKVFLKVPIHIEKVLNNNNMLHNARLQVRKGHCYNLDCFFVSVL